MKFSGSYQLAETLKGGVKARGEGKGLSCKGKRNPQHGVKVFFRGNGHSGKNVATRGAGGSTGGIKAHTTYEAKIDKRVLRRKKV